MYQRAAKTILNDRRIAYLLTDRQLMIVESGGATSLLWDHPGVWIGYSLLEAIPELQGSEAALDDVLSGALARLQIPWVNRDLPDGRSLYLTFVTLPHRDVSGAIQGVLHLIQDVTDLGQLEQRVMQQRNELLLLQDRLREQNLQLTAANAELRRVDEIRSAFVSIAAHELRTPLASISGYLEMLLDGDAGEITTRQAEWLHTIEDSARRLLQITNDLLDVTRLETGRLELIMQPTDLVAVVASVMTEQTPQIEARGQRLLVQAPAQLPLALCDAMRAAQIIGNLLSNASKYSPQDSTINVSLCEADEPGFVRLSVADQGPGIAVEHQSRLFMPFYRAPVAARSGVSGAGLGLYIARALIELHGGRIWFDSVLDRGATFHVVFPQAVIPRRSQASFVPSA